MRSLLTTLFLIGFSFFGFAQAPESLKHSATSYVDDFANTFTPDQAKQLDQVIRAFHDTAQISLVTVNTLNGLEPSEYAVKLGNLWGVGSHSNNGLLILISPSEHKFFAATGGGIQGDLTDDLCTSLYNEYAKPKYKEGDMFGGTMDVLNQYISRLSPSAKALRAEQEKAEATLTAKNEAKIKSAMANIFFILLGIGAIIGIVVYVRKQNAKTRQELKEAKGKYDTLISSVNNRISTVDEGIKNKIPEALEVRKKYNETNLSINVPSGKWKKADYDKSSELCRTFIDTNKNTIRQINNKISEIQRAEQDKKDTLALGKSTVLKYQDVINTVDTRMNRVVESLKKLVFEKYDITAFINNVTMAKQVLISALTTLSDAMVNQDLSSINSAVNAVSSADKKIDKIIDDANSTIHAENNKVTLAQNGKDSIEKQLAQYEAYTNKRGVSAGAADKTKNKVSEVRQQLSQYRSGMSLLEMYALYMLISPLLTGCNDAKRESDAYEAEETRKAQAEQQRLAAIAAEEARKRAAEKKKRDDEEDEERRRRNSYSSSYGISSSESSSSSSWSDSSSSSFGGGSFDGGGGGGGW